MVAAVLRSALAVAALVASTSALQLQLQRPLAPSSSAVRLRRTLPRLDVSDKSVDAETQKLAADKAALEAERATLQAEILSLRGEKIKLEASPLDGSTTTPTPPPAAATATTVGGALEVGASVEALCQVLNGTEFPGVGVLQAASLGAWDVARRQQTDEIAALVARVQLAEQVQGAETPEAELDLGGRAARQTLFLEEGERSRKASLSLTDLWLLSENRSFDSTTERRVRARALSRQVLGFLGERVEGEEKEEERVAVPGEGLVALSGAKARLRSLRRHEAAGLVEWRLFGEVLARDDELGAALELDEPLCEEDALQAVQVLFSRYLFKSDRDSYDEMLGELKENGEAEADIAAIFTQAAEGKTDTTLERWLQLLADILSKTSWKKQEAVVMEGMELTLEADEPDSMEQITALLASLFGSVAYPALLMSQCARQGCFEAIPVYTTARLLASINVESLARFEGFDVPGEPQTSVSEQEGLLMQADIKEVIDQFSSFIVGGSILLLLLFAVVAWQVVGFAWPLLFASGSVDPLDF